METVVEQACTQDDYARFEMKYNVGRYGQHSLFTINWKVGLTQKKSCRNATIVLSILMKNRINSSNFSNF